MESILSEHDGGANDAPMDFDMLFDTKALRIMRVLIPFFPTPYQPLLAVWLRFSQLRYALSLMNDMQFRANMTRRIAQMGSGEPEEQTLSRLLGALKPCLSKSEYQELCRIQNMFSMYQRFQRIAPYLSALSGVSGDASLADMMNLFSAMQGGDNSAADIMNAFSAMQGVDNSAADIINAFSAMQGVDNSTADATAGMHASSSAQAADTFETDGSTANAAQEYSDDTNSSETQNMGAGMDLDRILDLISLFQTSSAEADTNTNTTERQEEQES
ncbi:MAG: hypothetical protein NC409_01765 [Clostridium sp.]|nr:hypothetical protein [Clostridium sp.]